MATSRSAGVATARGAIVAAGLFVALLASACGSAGSAATAGNTASAGVLASLRTQAAPHDWRSVRLAAGGAALAAPPGWRRVSGDPGSATFVLGANADHPRAYLNATPATEEEQLGSWVGFRLSHNRGEGDRNVRLLAARGGLRLGGRRRGTVRAGRLHQRHHPLHRDRLPGTGSVGADGDRGRLADAGVAAGAGDAHACDRHGRDRVNTTRAATNVTAEVIRRRER